MSKHLDYQDISRHNSQKNISEAQINIITKLKYNNYNNQRLSAVNIKKTPKPITYRTLLKNELYPWYNIKDFLS